MDSHQKWRNPPIRETVFEVRFPPVPDYSIFAGGIASVIQNRFPDSSLLPGANLPLNFGGVVRHRFASEDTFTLIQIGIDVASVNCIAYPGFERFSEELTFMLENLRSFVDLGQKKRLGLRYINQFEDVVNPFDVIDLLPPFKNFDISNTERIYINHIKKDFYPLMLSINVEFPTGKNGMEMLFDLDAHQTDFGEFDNKRDLVSELVGWAEAAHDIVWQNFESIISEEEKNKRV
jgi:uncharacterized protein (TIGR04255 family)